MDYSFDNVSIGKRIRFYRQKKGMTQKTLAELCDLSEAAIRNYELGNRTPDCETIIRIAGNLGVSYYAINDPTLEDILGALHILFRMEEIYDLHPEISGEKVRLSFENASPRHTLDSAGGLLAQAVRLWDKMYRKYQQGKISAEEYESWKSRYPEFVTSIPTSTTLDLEQPQNLDSAAAIKRKKNKHIGE